MTTQSEQAEYVVESDASGFGAFRFQIIDSDTRVVVARSWHEKLAQEVADAMSQASAPAPSASTCKDGLQVPECAWMEDECDIEGPSWLSACDERWIFNDGGPVENRVNFCQGCGGRVVVSLPPAPSEDQ